MECHGRWRDRSWSLSTFSISAHPTLGDGFTRDSSVLSPCSLATPNDLARFRRTGHRRDLNRPQFRLDAIERRLQDPDADATNVLAALRHALEVRSSQQALHPDAAMTVLSSDRSDLVILKRSRDDDNALYAVHNITPNRLTLSLAQLKAEFDNGFVDCLSGQ